MTTGDFLLGFFRLPSMNIMDMNAFTKIVRLLADMFNDFFVEDLSIHIHH
jgi:hypothetical protein